MAILNKGQTFSDGEQVTSAKLNTLVDGSTFGSGAVDDVSTQLSGGSIIVKDGGITASKMADSNVTKEKIENVANMKVLGNTSGSSTSPQEVSVLDEDDMYSDSNTSIPTQQSVKAYADGSSNFTTEDSQSAGYQIFPSGLKMAWGDAQTTNSSTITFPSGVNFLVAPTVQLTFNKAINVEPYYGAQLKNVTTSQFTYAGSYSNQYGARYLAIGH
jgi:hypothetical protein